MPSCENCQKLEYITLPFVFFCEEASQPTHVHLHGIWVCRHAPVSFEVEPFIFMKESVDQPDAMDLGAMASSALMMGCS